LLCVGALFACAAAPVSAGPVNVDIEPAAPALASGPADSPVEERAAKKKRQPVAMALVIDRSGSMSGMPIDMARSACKDVANGLAVNDWLLVVAFDTQPQLAVKLQRVGDRNAIRKNIDRIQPGGGTDLYPALKIAMEQLQTAPTKVKQVLLLTDGLAPIDGIKETAKAMAKQGIVVSSIGLGSSVDDKLLAKIADIGGGRFHAVDNPRVLRKLFQNELKVLLARATKAR